MTTSFSGSILCKSWPGTGYAVYFSLCCWVGWQHLKMVLHLYQLNIHFSFNLLILCSWYTVIKWSNIRQSWSRKMSFSVSSSMVLWK